MKTRLERWWSLVIPDRDSSCWLWSGAHNQAGYGLFHWANNRGARQCIGAHRAGWLLLVGEIPNEMCILHRCDVPACVNPAHLFLGSHRDNAADMISKGRRAKRHRPHTRVNKLTDDQVRAIRLDDRPVAVVALAYRTSMPNVSKIRRRKAKALVPDDPP